jgi:hypothetical protein
MWTKIRPELFLLLKNDMWTKGVLYVASSMFLGATEFSLAEHDQSTFELCSADMP